jgi:hypothetical protein
MHMGPRERLHAFTVPYVYKPMAMETATALNGCACVGSLDKLYEAAKVSGVAALCITRSAHWAALWPGCREKERARARARERERERERARERESERERERERARARERERERESTYRTHVQAYIQKRKWLEEQVGVPFVRFRPNPDPKLNPKLHTYHTETEWLATRGLIGNKLN